jgi:hypothetical protein
LFVTVMRRNIRLWIVVTLSCLLVVLFLSKLPATAQQTTSRIVITGSDASGAPTIELYVYAVDSQGNPLDLSEGALVVRHNGKEINAVQLADRREFDAFTIFVVDTPPSVEHYIDTIQQSIVQFASDPTMKEGVDYVAIFAVDEAAARPILEPQEFHNGVRNAFATRLTPSEGKTALIDSLMGILNNLETLKPNPDLIEQIVVISDGTDAVSTQFTADDVPRLASEIGVPIHTIWLDNPALTESDKQVGKDYMTQLAAETSGLTHIMSTTADIVPFWEIIAAFRTQNVIRYELDDLTGDEHSVDISLADNPEIRAQTALEVPEVSPSAPSIVIEIPPESRNLIRSTLDEPINLSISTSISWPDGVDRQITKAQLLLNGIEIQDVDVANINQFDAAISKYTFGPNQLQLFVADEQGGRATSPAISLIVEEDIEGVTSEIETPTDSESIISRVTSRVSGLGALIGGCVLVGFVLVVLAGFTVLAGRSGLFRSLRLTSHLQRISFLRPYIYDARRVQRVARRAERTKNRFGRYAPEVRGSSPRKKSGTRPAAFLEILESRTKMGSRLDLDDNELKLGRSANQADIVFKNDNTVSRIHASVVREGSDYRIFDEQSTSGTWVNEQRVPEYGLQLVNGDEIRLGAVRLRFRQP